MNQVGGRQQDNWSKPPPPLPLLQFKSPLLSVMITCAFFSAWFDQGRATSVNCPSGQFPCGNSTQCLDRILHCDGIVNCYNGADEEQCHDVYGGIKDFFTGLVPSSGPVKFPLMPDRNSCYLVRYPLECRCEFGSTVNCVGARLLYVPQDISHQIKTLHLEKNGIRRIIARTFQNMTSLKTLSLAQNEIRYLQRSSFKGLVNLQNLFLQMNKLDDASISVFGDVPAIRWLILSNNNIQLRNVSFPSLPYITFLHLDNNLIESISEETFASLKTLRALFLAHNNLRLIETGSLSLISLRELDLSANNLKILNSNTFQGLNSLSSLMLNRNPIRNLPVSVFDKIPNIKSMYLRGIDIDNLEIRTFQSTRHLKIIHFKKFLYCSYVPHVRICEPRTDGLSSTEHLLVKPMLRICVWVVAAITCVGNFLVLVGRFLATQDEPGRISMLFIKNLSFADFLMGVYLCVVGTKDIIFRDNYMRYAHSWMSSNWCVFCGIIAMASSEVSVLILSLMSIERHFRIVNPFRALDLAPRNTYITLILIWAMGLILAAIPALPWLYHDGKQTFYGTNGLCFPLHISDPYIEGWQYSAFIFLGINFAGVVIIAVTYTSMYISIQNTRSKTPQRTGELDITKRFFFIVLTDCLCWIPIIILKIFALCHYKIPDDVHAWIVIFILPVNSAMNPIIYTLSSKEFRKKVKSFLNKSRMFWWLPSRRRVILKDRSTYSATRTASTKTSIGFGSLKLFSRTDIDIRIIAAGPRRHTTQLPVYSEDFI